MSKTPVAGIEDRAPGERASSQGKATIQPTDVRGAGETFAEMITEIDPGTGRPVAESAAESAAPPSVADAVAAIPELEEVRRVYGERGVEQVILAARQQHVAAESKKLEADPELGPIWSDPEARAEVVREIRTHAKAHGFSDAEIDAVTDARTVKIAYHSLLRDKQLAAPRPPAAAARPAVDEQAARVQEAMERAAKTGRVRDAAKAMETFVREVSSE